MSPLINTQTLFCLDAFDRNHQLQLKQACFAGCAQNLPDEAPPIGKIHPLIKIAVTFEPIQRF